MSIIQDNAFKSAVLGGLLCGALSLVFGGGSGALLVDTAGAFNALKMTIIMERAGVEKTHLAESTVQTMGRNRNMLRTVKVV